jgi:hypothetical protein
MFCGLGKNISAHSTILIWEIWMALPFLGAYQLCITCESLRELIKRYGEYEHDDGMVDHQIGLNKNVLLTIENDDNIRIFKGEELLDSKSANQVKIIEKDFL